MKNIPFFTTMYGVASLTLDQIPFNRIAYIRIQTALEPDPLLKECLDFCKAVGAETVYATGINEPGNSLACVSVIRMTRKRAGLSNTDLTIVSADKSNGDSFRSIFNEHMRKISHASAMTGDDLNAIIEKENGYLLYRNQHLQGIGVADGEWIRAIISIEKGAGEAVLLGLNQMLKGESVTVELVDSNQRAKRLYEKMGFRLCETVSTWYKIL